jgi:hypothetical protein
MTKRKSYKTLYLAVSAQLEQSRHDHANTKARLADIESSLIPYGRKRLEAVPAGEGQIDMDALGFVAARCFMEANQRITYDGGGYSQLYTWRGRPLIRQSATPQERD